MKCRFPKFVIFVAALALCACVMAPSVDESRQALWSRFGNHPVDEVILAWGAPQAETKLGNGTRVLTYRRTRMYWRDFPYGYTTYGDTAECDASFQAPPPNYLISNVSLDGDIFQCADLAAGNPASGPASAF